jgi:hypothetical protein
MTRGCPEYTNRRARERSVQCGEFHAKRRRVVQLFSAAGFTGIDSFSYRANDGVDDASAATVTITLIELKTNPSRATILQDGEGDALSVPSVESGQR